MEQPIPPHGRTTRLVQAMVAFPLAALIGFGGSVFVRSYWYEPRDGASPSTRSPRPPGAGPEGQSPAPRTEGARPENAPTHPGGRFDLS